jgi:16S rRNA (guanine527-N7)-methyltransferase
MVLFYNQPLMNQPLMDPARISGLLRPFLLPLPGYDGAPDLDQGQLDNILMYIDILQRWNLRLNLTSIRDEESIVTRHFGESLFMARHLFAAARGGAPAPPFPRRDSHEQDGTGDRTDASVRLIDVGSGAGFPGLPIKLWVPTINLTLIESNHKKATFLREVIRKLALTKAEVFAGRAEDFASTGEIVTMRAVERFDQALVAAVKLISPGGRIALLVAEGQRARAEQLIPDFRWSSVPLPESITRILLMGARETR